VTGAAATAVVTSAVGEPVIMGALLAGGTGAVAIGSYKVGQFTTDKFGEWSRNYCSLKLAQRVETRKVVN